MILLECELLEQAYLSPRHAARLIWPPPPAEVLHCLRAGLPGDVARRLLSPLAQSAPDYLLPKVTVGRSVEGFLAAMPPTVRSIFIFWRHVETTARLAEHLRDLETRTLRLGSATVRVRTVSTLPGDSSYVWVRPADAAVPSSAAEIVTLPASTGGTLAYERPWEAIQDRLPPITLAERECEWAMRYTLQSSAPLPSLLAHDVAEQFRRAAMQNYGQRNGGGMSAQIAGKDPTTGTPVRGHRHAFYLPTDEDGDGYLDSLVVYIASGASVRETQALLAVKGLHAWSAWARDIALTPTAFGPLRDSQVRTSSKVFALSREWVSHTPFALVRHPKVRAGELVDTPTQQAAEEIVRRKPGATLVSVEVQPHPNVASLSGRHLKQGVRYSVRAALSEPVEGPIAIGSACHFGMGLMIPAIPHA